MSKEKVEKIKELIKEAQKIYDSLLSEEQGEIDKFFDGLE